MSYSDLLHAAFLTWSDSTLFWLIGGLAVFLIGFSKGAFGGGAASIGVPMMSLFTDPIGAAIICAPLVSLMDMFTLRSFGPSSWSRPDLAVLLPGLVLGIGLGWLLFETVDHRIVGALIATIGIVFALYWFWKRLRRVDVQPRPADRLAGLAAGTASGFTTFIAHAGGPPVTMYLVGRGLDKRLFVGTNTAFFTFGNLLKLGPYGFPLAARPDAAAAAILLAPIIPLAVMLGIRAHRHLTQDQILIVTNLVLIVGGLRLLHQSLASLLS